MFPTLFHLGPVPVPTHDALIALGAAVGAVVFFREADRREPVHDPRLTLIILGALVSGALVAKASTAWQYVATTGDTDLVRIWLYGGRSVLGGLAGAYGGALIVKRLVGYRQSTGDYFGPAVAIAMAIGRVGCLLTEPIGRPTTLPWGYLPPPALAARIPDCEECVTGLPMHPTFVYEIVFHLAMFFVLMALRPHVHVRGDLFKIWLLAYGIFRFFNEFVRVNPELLWGLSGSQLFLIPTVPLLAAYFIRQVRAGEHRAPAGLAA